MPKTPFKFEIIGRLSDTSPAFGVGDIYDRAMDAQRAARLLAPQFGAIRLQVRPILSLTA